jgi:(p)ppGpp synthase/HD superfamily hydrolase
MSKDVLLLAQALDFAARKHATHRRKGARAEPYINHLAEVATLLAEATGGRDPALVVAGLLHDTIEDTKTTKAELTRLFGAKVAALVAEVSDDTSLAKAVRKRRQVETAPRKSRRAKMLKLADKTSNLRALAESPPKDWPLARRRGYVRWAHAVAAGCRGVNPALEAWFDEAYERAGASLKPSSPKR